MGQNIEFDQAALCSKFKRKLGWSAYEADTGTFGTHHEKREPRSDDGRDALNFFLGKANIGCQSSSQGHSAVGRL
jgi:hypothetical protein